MRMLTAFVALVLASANTMAAPEVSGTTISWPAGDDWYQVQRADTYESVCNGGTSCIVEPGLYNVINHSTGERFEGVQVDAPGIGDSGITITANTIAWPDNGDWFQVQRSSDYETICNGGKSCVVDPGNYVVINHSIGVRYEDIDVSDAPPPVTTVSVTDNVITYPDDGWYQVQDTQDYASICNGEKLCVVPDGEYVVINHSTGERFEPVVVSTGIEFTETPLINADNWQEILRNAISVMNGDLINEGNEYLLERFGPIATLARAEVYLNIGSEELSALGLTLVANSVEDGEADYSCNDGGTLSLIIPAASFVYTAIADNCAIAGDVFDGRIFYDGVGIRGVRAETSGMNVTLSDGSTILLYGRYVTALSRFGTSGTEGLVDVDYFAESAMGSYWLEKLLIVKESSSGIVPGTETVPVSVLSQNATVEAQEYLHKASIQGEFIATALWTGYAPMAVSVDMNFDSTVLAVDAIPGLDAPYTTTSNELVWPVDALPGALQSRWTEGSLTVSAGDGSTVTLTPDATNEGGAVVKVSALDDNQQVVLSEGYQVLCFDFKDAFEGC